MASPTGALRNRFTHLEIVRSSDLNPATGRLQSIDLLRGAVMVMMALDHVRDYMTWRAAPPEVLQSHYSIALFLTRWITHFCAPTFFFLAGTGASLMLARRSRSEVSRFLWTRGLWLMFLESTVVWFAWTFIPVPIPSMLVIFTLGLSMIVLAALIRVPVSWLAAISLLIIALHNAFDRINASSLSSPLRELWMVLHEPGFLVTKPQPLFFVLYPLIPWFAVMVAGFCFGTCAIRDGQLRVRLTAIVGASATALFVLMRAINHYGNGMNPNMFATGPWTEMPSTAMTVASFLNTTKYPPSLDYLLMTLGPALLCIALFSRIGAGDGWLARKILVFGRVPMFYYLCHLFVVHLTALTIATLFHQPARHLGWMGGGFMVSQLPNGFGFNLPMIYFAWLFSVVLLYFPCAWYANYKREHKDNKWLSYL